MFRDLCPIRVIQMKRPRFTLEQQAGASMGRMPASKPLRPNPGRIWVLGDYRQTITVVRSLTRAGYAVPLSSGDARNSTARQYRKQLAGAIAKRMKLPSPQAVAQ